MVARSRTTRTTRGQREENSRDDLIEEAATAHQPVRYRQRFTEEREVPKELEHELDRVLALPTVQGARLLDLLAEFKSFPWTQDTALAALNFGEVLQLFLQRYMGISGEVLRQWTVEGVVLPNALGALATYEACHEPEVRPDIEELIVEYKSQA